MNIRVLAKRLSGYRWHYIHRRFRTPLYMHLLCEGLSYHRNSNERFPYECPRVLVLDSDIAIEEDTWKQMQTRMWRELQRNPRFFLQYCKKGYVLNERIERFARVCAREKYHSMGISRLRVLWERYYTFSNHFGAFLLLPLFVEQRLEEELSKSIVRLFPAALHQEIFQVFTTPCRRGTTANEEQSLLRMACDIKQDKDIARKLNAHLRDFAWMKNNAFDGSFDSLHEIKERMHKAAIKNPCNALEDFKRKIKMHKTAFRHYCAQLSSKEKQILTTLQELIYYRSWRTERYYRNAWFLQSFFAHTADVLDIESKDIFYLTAPEVMKALTYARAGFDRSLIEERKRGYGMYSGFQTTMLFSGADLSMLKRAVHFFGDEERGVITGVCAYPGIIRGVVVYVHTKADLKKVTKGAIVVASSTTVDFVPILKNVKGLITDEGGVLSHASVIARELHIPCVIGTHTATRVLNDGDRVELDATAGMVHIIAAKRKV